MRQKTREFLPAPRRRGAPDGNTNALKHGYYSRLFRKSDLEGLGTFHSTGLADEIAMLRVFIHRVTDLGKKTNDMVDALNLLRGLCVAVSTLNRLIGTQHLILPFESETEQALRQAIMEFAHEKGLDKLEANDDEQPPEEVEAVAPDDPGQSPFSPPGPQ